MCLVCLSLLLNENVFFFSEHFEHLKVDFKQTNLASPASVEKAFQCDDGNPFHYVINLAAETKYSQSEEVIVFALPSSSFPH